ncbi:N-acetyltransferase [Saitoella complicata NRRL Y-17804]|uniref:N-acetyltransferase domain-containing protein n=1 Tax=Saitoella complicata (strain BCRC 22490 / CBS 7301 / JCM 7358 / NBRC 10748 / NRRL Y-17804) TaxID=698492 RepID=A0A0E9NP43_SAICN|nr:N-acetyltransferase [Saitoella complicata NRRL Y-17804]ODQ51326.1 N-acetyltransferase [Saitoella complicata NRRL Y-17804]GAO51652.1 hypothetical protein G7K_5745-t1 [Saitoella complicata NRRL Y-17804]
MSELRRFRATDLFEFNNVNLDVLTETYNISFYLSYLATWPDLFTTTLSPTTQQPIAYIMGKSEGTGTLWHTHVTALTVSPSHRRLGLARILMNMLERTGEESYDAFFVDLFVRCGNEVAIGMYEGFDYSVFRRVVGYYSGGKGEEEDAFDMRRPLRRDKERKSIRENGRDVRVQPQDVWF